MVKFSSWFLAVEIEFYSKDNPYFFIGVVVGWKQHYVYGRSHIPDIACLIIKF